MLRSLQQRIRRCTLPSDWWNFGWSALVGIAVSGLGLHADEDPRTEIAPRRQLHAAAAKDQDDFCFWVSPHSSAESTIIASDKSAGALFVYDLSGKLLQHVAATKPGNIDIRQGVMLDGKPTDIVVVNQRSNGFKLRVFRVNPQSRELERLDDDNILTGPNYGGCLYLSRLTGKLSFLCTTEESIVEQHEITGDRQGHVVGKKLRSWPLGKCEGAVADDETGFFYIAEENKGIWKVGAEPESSTPGELIARVGKEDDLTGDLEGLALYRQPDGAGCLIVSDQGSNRFVAFDRTAPHRRLGEFRVTGARETDGIELLTGPFGPDFPDGVFACHTDLGPRAIQLSSWREIRTLLRLPDPVPYDRPGRR